MTVYATETEFQARLSATYVVPDDAAALLSRASEIIDHETLGRAQEAYDSEEGEDETPLRTALSNAACDQVEFWIEVGPEHDVAGLKGSLVAGRLQVHPVPALLGTRARRTLTDAGLLWRGVAAG